MFLNSNSDSISVQIEAPTLLTGSVLQADGPWTNCPGASSTHTLPTCFLGGTSITGFALAHLLWSHRVFRSPYLTPRGCSPVLIQSCTPNATGKLVTDLLQFFPGVWTGVSRYDEVPLFLSTEAAEHTLKNVIDTTEFKFTSTTFYLCDFGKSLSVS